MRQPAVNIGIKAARQAGHILIRMLRRLESLPVTEKDHNDVVTEADLAAERAIIEEIRRMHPEYGFLAEESGAIGDQSTRWIIDPLDGTKNFIMGIPHFAVSLALQINGVIEHGIVYDPLREELFTASRGGGAYLNDHRIRASNRRSLPGAMLATGFPFRQKQHLPTYLNTFSALFAEASDVRRAGSAALDLAYVAAGRLDGFWEIGLNAWDMAAGVLLIQEAGGACFDFSGRDGFLESGNIIAGNLKVAVAMHRKIAPHLVEGLKR